jgi:hypothetical protein
LPNSLSIQNGLKPGLSPLLFNFALKYSIRKIQDNQVGLKLNATHELLAYAGAITLLGDNIDTINKNRILTEAGKTFALDMKVVKSNYMLLSHCPNAEQTWDIKITNKSSENVSVQIFGKNRSKPTFNSGRN